MGCAYFFLCIPVRRNSSVPPVAHPCHVNQRGGVNINAKSHCAGLSGFIGKFDDLFRFARFNDGNPAPLLRLDCRKATPEGCRIRTSPVMPNTPACTDPVTTDEEYSASVIVHFMLTEVPPTAAAKTRDRVNSCPNRVVDINWRINSVQGTQIQSYVCQRVEIVAERHSRTYSTMPGNLSGAGIRCTRDKPCTRR